jgi:Na+/H+-dicarboxylate symporter
MSQTADIATPKNAYQRIPLFVKILIALVLGALLGLRLGKDAEAIKVVSDTILKLLRLLATPLIFSAVLSNIVTTKIEGKKAFKLLWLLMSNTVIAILIGLVVANVVQPGKHLMLEKGAATDKVPYNIWKHLLDSIPTDFITPFQKNDIIGIIIIAIGLGVAMRLVIAHANPAISSSVASLNRVFQAFYELIITILKWVFELVPVAVFAVVAAVVGAKGLGALTVMVYWIGSVVFALLLMATFYMVRLWLTSNIKPKDFLRGGVDAFAMAFSTASSAATLPVTYRCVVENLKVKKDSASMGVMVGGTFNHDGTALYEAMAALFIAQGIGMTLGISQQIIVVLMAIIASVGAAGIPEAGLVTMLAVFKAVDLPTEYIPFLLTVDWFLDRCRTTINVMGDMVSTCILDREKAITSPSEPAVH